MATGFGAALLDTPEAKVFTFRVDENDPAGTETVLTFGAVGMVNMKAAANEKIVCEVTPAATLMTTGVTIAVHTPTIFGVTITKTSVDTGAALDHTFRIFLHSRPFYG
jgi:hypothetical protein